MGIRGIRGMKTRVRRECCIRRGGKIVQGGIPVGGVWGVSHSFTSGVMAGRQLQE